MFVPGNRPERFAKAASSGADEVVIDLEDAVGPDHKPAARRAVADWLDESGQAWVRINAHSTTWYADDIAAIVKSPGLRGIIVPKAENPTRLANLAQRLRTGRGLVALVESALGIHNAHQLAAVAGVEELAFGSIDFAVDIDATEGDDSMLLARSTLVLASRVAGLPAPIDGVTVAARDTTAVAAAAQHARHLGFGGKLCIHPAQLAPAAAAFLPTDSDIAWAREVVATTADDSGAVRLGNNMIDAPVIARARRILTRAT
nr:CoA ester lyase [Antrihabitans stalactiti]